MKTTAAEIAKLKEQFGLDAELVYGEMCVYEAGNGFYNVVGSSGIPNHGCSNKQKAIDYAKNILLKVKANQAGVDVEILKAFYDVCEEDSGEE